MLAAVPAGNVKANGTTAGEEARATNAPPCHVDVLLIIHTSTRMRQYESLPRKVCRYFP